jgi:hypothetical protein
MNPYGTTRQDVGGRNYANEPKRIRWYGTVPFRPCRPPTPDWIKDWPIEQETKVAPYLLMYAACRDAELLQDPRTGLLPPGFVLNQQGQPIPAVSAGVSNIPKLNLRKQWITWGLGTNAGTRSTVSLGLMLAPFMIRQITYGSDDAGGFPMQFNLEFGSAIAPITESVVAVASQRPYKPILPVLLQQSSFSSLPPGTAVGWPLMQSNNRPGYTTFSPKFIVYESTYLSLSYANYGGIASNALGEIEIVDQCTLEDLRAFMV